MDESLAKLLIANNMEPDSFTTSEPGGAIYRGMLPAGRAMPTWVNLAKGFSETKYWPIIRGKAGDLQEQTQRDPASILAAAPAGNIREILKPRVEERRKSLLGMIPMLSERGAAALAHIGDDSDMDQLAAAADVSGIYTFSGRGSETEEWPTEPPNQARVKMNTVKEQKGQPAALSLIRVEHSYEVPAYLEFGRWNDCPPPELQVAALREWGNEYRARPACITGDVLGFVVVNRPQTEAQSMKLAAEQWIFCEDIVGQGTQSVRKLAMGIWRAPTWFFWWD
jgi:hypothetical protein